MVKVGYNPSTGKVLLCDSGKVSEGCCVAAIPCSRCPTPSATPATIEVTIAGMVNCDCFQFDGGVFTCAEFWTTYGSTNDDFASEFNGVHTLSQVSSCVWRKDISVSFEIDVTQNEPPVTPGNECDGTPCKTWDIETLRIQVGKNADGSVRVELFAIDPLEAAIFRLQRLFQVAGCATTGTDCFDCTGFPASFASCDITSSDDRVVGGGTIDITG